MITCRWWSSGYGHRLPSDRPGFNSGRMYCPFFSFLFANSGFYTSCFNFVDGPFCCRWTGSLTGLSSVDEQGVSRDHVASASVRGQVVIIDACHSGVGCTRLSPHPVGKPNAVVVPMGSNRPSKQPAGDWSSGVIPASGAGGRELDSLITPPYWHV